MGTNSHCRCLDHDFHREHAERRRVERGVRDLRSKLDRAVNLLKPFRDIRCDCDDDLNYKCLGCEIREFLNSLEHKDDPPVETTP